VKVLFYISGHGFGHATRIVAIMTALIAKYPTIKIFVRTKVSKRLFEDLPTSLVKYSEVALDVGVIEKDIFSQDVYSSLNSYLEIYKMQDRIVSVEVEFIKQEGINIIVSDIPPLASEIGQAGGLPTIAVGNFSWDYIYEPYLLKYPNFADIVSKIRASYKKTRLLLRLPFHHDMSAFPKKQDIPLIVRKSNIEHSAILSRLGIEVNDPRSIILLGMRMYDVIPPHAIQELINTNKFIILFADTPPFKIESLSSNVRVLGTQWKSSEFPAIVGISDLVISKLGYGIVSECISGKSPLMYLPRYDFAEYDILKNAISPVLPTYIMPKDDFLEGKWYKHVAAFLSQQFEWPDFRTDGAEVAAEIILSYATKG
jgi:hypothetical protein